MKKRTSTAAMFLESANSRCNLKLSLVLFCSSLLRQCQWRYPTLVCYLSWLCVNRKNQSYFFVDTAGKPYTFVS